jgi:putative nucleotidyltransferase with HDIG domain
MNAPRTPPRLVVKTLGVTFVTTAVLLAVTFVIVIVSVGDRVRAGVAANLEASQRMFAAVESRERRQLRAQAATVAENPTLKAAIDTYAAESRLGDSRVREQLLNTMTGELAKVAKRIDVDAVVVVDQDQRALAAAGPLAARWPLGRSLAPVLASTDSDAFDGVVHIDQEAFSIVSVPLVLGDGTRIGALDLATSLDRRYAQRLGELARANTVIMANGLVVASTLDRDAERHIESLAPALAKGEGTIGLNKETHEFRRLVQVGDTSFYALASIDESARGTTAAMSRTLAWIGVGAMAFALLTSLWLANLLAKPIGRLSTSLVAMSLSRQFDVGLPLTGSSQELDALTTTFNDLMASVSAAEAQTEAAYMGAIRALAAALDARDPYTAGHSERVSALSVSIGMALKLPPSDLEILGLGALLHDIGKIGVPDEVLRKPTALTPEEIDVIKQHPALGARILKAVPFLSPHMPIVELHHERPDGRGYPHGLRGDDIPMAARIVHVADAYDAMTSARAYRKARPSDEALRELWRCSGTEFHAEIVGALTTALSFSPPAEPPLAEPMSA